MLKKTILPFCDPCDIERKPCPPKDQADIQCQVYHFGDNYQGPSKLPNLGIGNNVSAETILEKLSYVLCAEFNQPINIVNTFTLTLVDGDPCTHTLSGNVNVSATLLNRFTIKPDGAYAGIPIAPYTVKVLEDGLIDGYLSQKLIGGCSPSGITCIKESVLDDMLQLIPTLDLAKLQQALLDDVSFINRLMMKVTYAVINNTEFLERITNAVLNNIITNSEFLLRLSQAILDTIINTKEYLNRLTIAILNNIVNNQEFLDKLCNILGNCGCEDVPTLFTINCCANPEDAVINCGGSTTLTYASGMFSSNVLFRADANGITLDMPYPISMSGGGGSVEVPFIGTGTIEIWVFGSFSAKMIDSVGYETPPQTPSFDSLPGYPFAWKFTFTGVEFDGITPVQLVIG